MMNHRNSGPRRLRVLSCAALGIMAAGLLMASGCTSTPASETLPPPRTTGEAPETPAPAAEKPEKTPKPVVRTVYLLANERVYRADGSLESHREYRYEAEGAGMAEELRYSGSGRLMQTRVYALKEGIPIEERHYDEDNQLRSLRRYQYDSQGNITEEQVYDAADELQTRSNYEYDERGRRTSWRVFTGFAGFMGTTVYHYDNGNPARIEILNPRDELEEYFMNEFDDAGHPTRRTHYDATGRRLAFVEYEYEGNLLQTETSYRSGGAVQRSVHFEYDGAGNVVIEYHRDRYGNLRERIEREFIRREIQE